VELEEICYRGPPIDDLPTFEQLPAEYQALLEQINGFIQWGGGLHGRGACHEPAWHAIATAWRGELALHRLYPAVRESDVPFAQDALGDQYLLRDVWRLAGETGELESVGVGLFDFLATAQNDPIATLSLQPLVRFWEQGGALEPGQLLNVYPPFCFQESARGVSFRPTSSAGQIRFLAALVAQLANLPPGSRVRLVPRPEVAQESEETTEE
jgi:hypothetical protein